MISHIPTKYYCYFRQTFPGLLCNYDSCPPAEYIRSMQSLLPANITPGHVLAFRHSLPRKPNSTCRYAAHIRLMHPIEIEIKLPHTAPKPAQMLSQPEQKRIALFAEKLPTARKVGLLLMMQMGLRIGEVCGMQWGDFDLTAGVLSVRRTVKRIYVANGQTKIVVQTPKTHSSVRQIPIPQGILQILNHLYSGDAPQEWFLSGNANKPVEPRCYRKSLHSYLRRAGVPAVNPHALRHTFATTCLQAGCNVKTLSELLGHASSDITMKRYVHTCWDWKRAEMDRIFAQ